MEINGKNIINNNKQVSEWVKRRKIRDLWPEASCLFLGFLSQPHTQVNDMNKQRVWVFLCEVGRQASKWTHISIDKTVKKTSWHELMSLTHP
jgi:hypothetical protein